MSELLEATDLEAATALLEELHLTDGLPIIVPTVERVERMVLASGLPSDYEIGALPPAFGAATIEQVAVAAVMAGCEPDYFPVVIAALGAVCDDKFDLSLAQGTTHVVAPLIIVNGPARHACGPIASSHGCLGPGFRPNATIGRALRLALLNIGGAYPGAGDPSTGQPAKFTYCVAENEEASPFPPLHVARGFDPEDSVVTVIGVEGPHSVRNVREDPSAADALLTELAQSIASPGAATRLMTTPQGAHSGVILLNPAHALTLAAGGHTRESVRDAIVQRATNTAAQLRLIYGSASGLDPSTPDDALVPVFQNRDFLIVLVAGAPSGYSAVMPSCGWIGRPVSRTIDLDQACDITPLLTRQIVHN